MSQQTLRDSKGRIIGTIIETGGGILSIRNHQNQVVGQYNANLDITFDKNNRQVGTGNLLTSLL